MRRLAGEQVLVDALQARIEGARQGGEIGKLDAKLGNADFVARAPEEVVDEQRERRDAEAARLEKITEALARLAA